MELLGVVLDLTVIALLALVWVELRDISSKFIDALVSKDDPEQYTQLQIARERQKSTKKMPASGTMPSAATPAGPTCPMAASWKLRNTTAWESSQPT